MLELYIIDILDNYIKYRIEYPINEYKLTRYQHNISGNISTKLEGVKTNSGSTSLLQII